MKRDFDLIRELLLHLESLRPEARAANSFNYPDRDTIEVSHALTLMQERGLIEAISVNFTAGSKAFANIRITWEGYDFLDSIRDDAIWRETKSEAKKFGAFSYDTLKALAKGLVKKKIEHHTGVELDFG